MNKKVLYVFVAFLILGSMDAIAGPFKEDGGIFEAVILFKNTPNPSADKTLIRMYLPESDPGATIRFLGADSTTMVKEISIGSLTGINSLPLNVSDWADGKYLFQLYYKGEVRDSHTLIVKH